MLLRTARYVSWAAVPLIAALGCAIDDRAPDVQQADAAALGMGGLPSAAGAGNAGEVVSGGGTADSGPAPSEADPTACARACNLAHAVATCSDGSCAVERCEGPFRDENGVASDGCEHGDLPGAGLELWFMGDRGVVAQDGFVSAWIDQSPNGLAATQTEIAERPLLIAPEADRPPMLYFDGSDDALVLPAGFAELDGAAFFAVVEAGPNPLCAGILHFSNGAEGDDIEFGRHQEAVLHYEVVGSAFPGTPGAFVTDRRLIVSAVQAGASSEAPGAVELRVDGVLDGAGVVELPALVERRENYVGRNSYTNQPALCSVYFRGRIGELIFYARGLDAAERERVEAYLRAKWQPE